MSRKDDTALVKLTVGFNALVDRELVDQLPPDLRGDAIPKLILALEKENAEYLAAKTDESGAVGSAGDVQAATRRMLVRVRHAVLAAYDDPEDPRIDGYGALGLGRNQSENQQRLLNLSQSTAAPFERGELPLAADLTPEHQANQAQAHADLNRDRGGATTDRQTERHQLEAARDKVRDTLQRVRSFVQAFLGDEALTEFGFDLPAPPTRPRLKHGEPAPAPSA